MLVLSIREGEAIQIGEVVVVFVERRRESIRLGFDAHASIRINKIEHTPPTQDANQCSN